MRLGTLVVGAGVGYVLGNEDARRRIQEMSGRLRGSSVAHETVAKLRTKAPSASEFIEQLTQEADAKSSAGAAKRAS